MRLDEASAPAWKGPLLATLGWPPTASGGIPTLQLYPVGFGECLTRIGE